LEPRSGHVGFMVEKVTLRQIFSDQFTFPCHFSFHKLLHTQLSSGAGTIGQLVADAPSELSLNPPQETTKKKRLRYTKFVLALRLTILKNSLFYSLIIEQQE
jgi:hypothetical protein